jgi:hypothetical protein
MDSDNTDTDIDGADTDSEATVGSYADEQVAVYHPIRGVLYGLLLGVGLAIYLIIFKVVSLTIPLPVIVILVCGALGGLWGQFGPPKKPKR